MTALVQKTENVRALLAVNVDRLLVPLLIIGALTVAGWVLSYATVY